MNRNARLAIILLLSVSAAGCQRLGLGQSNPPPLPAAPTPPVASQPLEPLSPVESDSLDPVVEPGQLPGEQTGLGQPMSSEPPASAREIGRSDMLGGWSLASGSDNCKLFMTLTTWSGGYRANTRGCGDEGLKGIAAWDLNGRQVILKDSSGTTVAQLYASAPERFNGQTALGASISVFR